jgi:DNA-binding transcriptional MerR regulator
MILKTFLTKRMMNKSSSAYKTISEVVKILGLKSKKGQSLPTHTLRYWEKEFKQIKPKILNGNRRYYDDNNIKVLQKVHFLLKEQGMTINGVKKILNSKEPLKLDEMTNHSIKAHKLKNKLKKISNLIKGLKLNK